MTQALHFRVFGIPMPDRSHEGYGRRARASSGVTNWKKVVAHYALTARPPKLLQGPLQVSMIFWMPRGPKVPPEAVLFSERPDLDNCFKSTADALQGVLYQDDCQIVESWGVQLYESPNQKPGVNVWIGEHEAQGYCSVLLKALLRMKGCRLDAVELVP